MKFTLNVEPSDEDSNPQEVAEAIQELLEDNGYEDVEVSNMGSNVPDETSTSDIDRTPMPGEPPSPALDRPPGLGAKKQ
jgi:hypothetical protein